MMLDGAYIYSRYHAGGSNTTATQQRRILNLNFYRSWLRTQNNQFLQIPRELVLKLDPQIQVRQSATLCTLCILIHYSGSRLLLSLPKPLSLSLSLCVCAPVCVSIACGAPACLSGCDFQVQCAASSWWDYDRRSRYHKVVHLAMHGTSAK